MAWDDYDHHATWAAGGFLVEATGNGRLASALVVRVTQRRVQDFLVRLLRTFDFLRNADVNIVTTDVELRGALVTPHLQCRRKH